MKKQIFIIIPFILIFGIILSTRFVALQSWDQGIYLHPDERFLVMVADKMSWPGSLTTYLDTHRSPLNPHNLGFNFYVYGTFPLVLTKLIAAPFGLEAYQHVGQVGRVISALLEVGIGFVVFEIARRIGGYKTGLLAFFFYALSVLPIQHAHFFTVDVFMVFFLTTSLLIVVSLYQFPQSRAFSKSLTLGIFWGMAISSKISAIIFFPIIAISFFLILLKTRKVFPLVFQALVFAAAAYFTVRIFYPYLFSSSEILNLTPNPQVVKNWLELKMYNSPGSNYPPSTMWGGTRPLWFPLENLVLWGLGLPLGLVSLFSLVYAIIKLVRRPLVVVLVVWIIVVFTYQATQYAYPMRYFYSLYPPLVILSAVVLSPLMSRLRTLPLTAVLFLFLLWPAAFVQIYMRPHSRVQASEWITQNLPRDSVLSCEIWDDCLPLPGRIPMAHSIVEFPMYDPDSVEKGELVAHRLSQVDFIVLSSNRLYGSIGSVPDRYPSSSLFYRELFKGNLGFRKVVEFTSRPTIPFPISFCIIPPGVSYGGESLGLLECSGGGMSVVDDFADETFTVYDHPKILIFQKTSLFNPEQIRSLYRQ